MGTGSRRRRYAVVAAAGAGALMLSTSPLWVVYVGRQLSWLEVRRVEVYGARLLEPQEVLRIAGVHDGQHLLERRGMWEAALLEHPVIQRATVTRKLPHTLRIRVEEKRPVALLSDGALHLVTGNGEMLPIDPATVLRDEPLDLPIVHGSLRDSVAAAATRRILAEADRLTALAPALMRGVSELETAPDDPAGFVLRHRDAEIAMPFAASERRIDELRRVLSDVERRFPSDGERASLKRRLDLRFADQIVVRPSSSHERP